MKRVLYTMPAVMVLLFYGMLAVLAGGVSGFQPWAWMVVLMPLAAAVLLVAGRWWGCVPGMMLGGMLISMGLMGNGNLAMICGGAVFAYYMVMGILCFTDARKKNK